MMDLRVNDEYEGNFLNLEEFREELKEQTENSGWELIPNENVRLENILPIDVMTAEWESEGQQETAYDTAETGTHLQLRVEGKKYPLMLRESAIQDMITRAGFGNGGSFFRNTRKNVDLDSFCNVINYGFEKFNSDSMTVLTRYGKVSACNSGRYEIIPVDEAFDYTLQAMGKKFGRLSFLSGYVSHTYTECLIALPDAKTQLVQEYADAFARNHFSPKYNLEDAVPELRFTSSDVGDSCMTLEPVWRIGQCRLKLSDGIRVWHKKPQADKTGLEVYKEGTDGIYAKFGDAAKEVERLTGITIENPENTVVGICREVHIGKKYGDVVREEVSAWPACTAYDIFCAFSTLPSYMESRNEPTHKINSIEDNIAKIRRLDMDKFDVGGLVAWDNE